MARSVETQPVKVIAVMGVTGSGKSNFLRLTTGLEGTNAPQIGDTLEACTQETVPYECEIDEQPFVFLDTPGFDDTHRGDAEILANIAQALCASNRPEMKLSGIIYLQRIKDERMTNALMRNLTMFKSLCGENAFKNVVLATTFWDEIPTQAKGEAREEQLKTKPEYWGYMLSKGSKLMRFLNSRDSALAIVNAIARQPAEKLQIQVEMMDRKLEIDQTTAGATLNTELTEVRETLQKEIDGLRAEREAAQRAHDAQLQEMFRKMEEEKRDALRQIEGEQRALQQDRREQFRRMDELLEDQKLRAQLRAEEMEQKYSHLMELTAQERRQYLELQEQSSQRIMELRTEMDRVVESNKEEKLRLQRTIRDYERRQKNAETEKERWTKELVKINEQILRVRDEQLNASETQKLELEQRIKDLESRKKRGWEKVLSVLAPIISIPLALLTGGISV